MSYSVYQHWDPLRVCVVGRSYPPEFYQWIKVPHVRELFERIAIETEEDFQNIIKTLQKFGVEIFRPEIAEIDSANQSFLAPPMTPRDTMVMIGKEFWISNPADWKSWYTIIKGRNWPWFDSHKEFLEGAEQWQIDEARNFFFMDEIMSGIDTRYQKIIDHIRQSGTQINLGSNNLVNGSMVSRIGKDLYFGTQNYKDDVDEISKWVNSKFPNYRNHIVNTGGHGDGVYCPVCPGLIISLRDVPTYQDTFPDWEVVYLPGQSWNKVRPFLDLKEKNRGRWWIPGFEYDDAVVEVVETWLSDWVGYVEETVFDVNMLIIDPKNVMVFNENEQVFKALDRYGITPHVVPFRHRYFWDGGIHCVTLDLHRDGVMQDFFPRRS